MAQIKDSNRLSLKLGDNQAIGVEIVRDNTVYDLQRAKTMAGIYLMCVSLRSDHVPQDPLLLGILNIKEMPLCKYESSPYLEFAAEEMARKKSGRPIDA